ncbi:MAG: CPBP family intramembrane glutamic endopeptidase [Bacteroidales bacterium]
MIFILKKIKYFIPTLKQCWVIVFFMCVIGAIGGGSIVEIIKIISGGKIGNVNALISYLIPMIPPFLYILYKGKEIARNNIIARERELDEHIQQPIPLNNTNLGNANIIIFVVICAVAGLAIGVVTEPLTSWMEMPENIRRLFESMMQKSVWTFIAVVIAAPIIEEFFLRGIMARGLFINTTPTKAILWSAFFFAFIHLNPWQAIPAFAVGVFIGWIYWRTHSLKACIFIHFINNGSVLLFSYLFPNIAIDVTTKEILSSLGQNIYPITYASLIIILIISIYYLNKKLPTSGFNQYQTPNSAVAKNILTNE